MSSGHPGSLAQMLPAAHEYDRGGCLQLHQDRSSEWELPQSDLRAPQKHASGIFPAVRVESQLRRARFLLWMPGRVTLLKPQLCSRTAVCSNIRSLPSFRSSFLPPDPATIAYSPAALSALGAKRAGETFLRLPGFVLRVPAFVLGVLDKRTGLQLAHGLAQLSLRVHHDRTVPRDRLFERLA
jgi:hypothetical protein